MTQLHLFPTVLRMIELEADSPRKAFYRLMIEEAMGQWTVIKESGAAGKVLDRRRWPAESMAHAVKKFNSVLADKLNPNRGSPRKYKRRADQTRRLMQSGVTKTPHINLLNPKKQANGN